MAAGKLLFFFVGQLICPVFIDDRKQKRKRMEDQDELRVFLKTEHWDFQSGPVKIFLWHKNCGEMKRSHASSASVA